jgi:hypothetical protein
MFDYLELQNGVKLGTYGYEKYSLTRIDETLLKNHNSSIQHLIWISQNELLVILDPSDGLGFKLIQFEISEPVEGRATLSVISEIRLDFVPFNTDFNVKSNNLAVQATNGQVYKYSNSFSFA